MRLPSGKTMGDNMKITVLIPLLFLLGACASSSESNPGERGVEEVRVPGQGQVYTAARNNDGDDPFARVDRQKSYDRPVSLRCRPSRSSE
jgi:hypothetical protein